MSEDRKMVTLIAGRTKIKNGFLKDFSEIEKEQLIKQLQQQKPISKFMKKTFKVDE